VIPNAATCPAGKQLTRRAHLQNIPLSLLGAMNSAPYVHCQQLTNNTAAQPRGGAMPVEIHSAWVREHDAIFLCQMRGRANVQSWHVWPQRRSLHQCIDWCMQTPEVAVHTTNKQEHIFHG